MILHFVQNDKGRGEASVVAGKWAGCFLSFEGDLQARDDRGRGGASVVVGREWAGRVYWAWGWGFGRWEVCVGRLGWVVLGGRCNQQWGCTFWIVEEKILMCAQGSV
jgi:hypothetical protein